jgi:uncharacterized protein
MVSLSGKEARLQRLLTGSRGLLVAFSGGLDSSVLLAAAARVLPRNSLLAVTAQSPTYTAAELGIARRIARQLGVRHRVVASDEFKDVNFVANPRNRCFFCKSALFSELRRIADDSGLVTVADGTNFDDRRDTRPGRRAARQWGVRSPLEQARLTKADLRALARRYGLPNWGSPAQACLASRVPYGVKLRPGRLAVIARAEEYLRQQGFRTVRVRDHDPVARIELGPDEITRAAEPGRRTRLVKRLRRIGFRFVALDLAGYETGSMNR